ncbi:cation transporter [Vibrio kasasachensis]|uniref:HMA2 domain-containing protein n=1 Tax=Vibrio kasasachensis TaxID=2910248 RepID=UPI003D11E697
MKQHISTALKLRKWVVIGHHIPGRVRLKYKMGIVAHLAKYKVQDIECALASIPAFKNCKLNHVTGSILIEYDASLVCPQRVEELFSDSEQQAEQACHAIAESLNLNGVNG